LKANIREAVEGGEKWYDPIIPFRNRAVLPIRLYGGGVFMPCPEDSIARSHERSDTMHVRPPRIVKKASKRFQKRMHHATFRFINGVDWVFRDPHQVLGQTPYDVIFKQDKLTLRRYRLPESELRGSDFELGTEKLILKYPKYPVPILMVPPLMVKPFIFDLWPERSFVLSMLRAGFDVFLVDFGEPDDADSFVRLDNYVMEWIPAVAREIRKTVETRKLTMVGYCMGGLFSLMYAATHANHWVSNIVSIGAPLDFSKMGPLAWVVKMGHGQIEHLIGKLGNIPGDLSSTMFKMISPTKNVTRYADLFMNMWNDEYVNGFDAMNHWVGEFIDYPAEAFQQFFHEFVYNNGFKEGGAVLGGKEVDLKKVDASLLAFVGRTDKVVPMKAATAVMDLVGSQDKELVVVPGGHMGAFSGASAPENVWKKTAQWLAPRSEID